MEYCPNGDLFEYVVTHKNTRHGVGLPEATARHFFQQLVTAVSFCHELGIANRFA